MSRIRSRDTRSTGRPTDWRDTAACLNENPELFFPKGHDGPWLLIIEEAKAVCRRCPVVEACLAYATEHKVEQGIYGGLTEPERRSLRRSVQRGKTKPHQVSAKVAAARQPDQPKPPTIGEYFRLNTETVEGGHRMWTGSKSPSWAGRTYTPKQLAFTVDRGHYPAGRVYAGCGVTGCVQPEHLSDQEERVTCGSRTAYQWHLRRGETPCEKCRRANSDADSRLRRSGSTLELAS
jgi:hypothetical protein